jgi:hypothetical protein
MLRCNISEQIYNPEAPGDYVVMNAIFGPEGYNTRYLPGFNDGTAIPMPYFYLDRNSQADNKIFMPAYKLAAAGYYNYDESDKILQQMADTDVAPIELENMIVISNYGFFRLRK